MLGLSLWWGGGTSIHTNSCLLWLYIQFTLRAIFQFIIRLPNNTHSEVLPVLKSNKSLGWIQSQEILGGTTAVRLNKQSRYNGKTRLCFCIFQLVCAHDESVLFGQNLSTTKVTSNEN